MTDIEVPAFVRFEHKVTWTIKNFDIRVQEPIISRRFDLKCFDVTTLSFCLYPKEATQTDYMQFSVRLHYTGLAASPELFLYSVMFVVYVVDEENAKHFSTQHVYLPSPSEPSSEAVNFVSLKDFKDEIHLHNCNELVLTCELTTIGKQREYLSNAYTPELLSLSSSLYSMLLDPGSNDMVAVGENQTGLSVHLCIMRARCPALFQKYDEANFKFTSERKSLWYSHMSIRGLKLLLSYLYGKVFIEVPNDLRSELRSFAFQHKLTHLERQLVEHPVHVGLSSVIAVEEATFKYVLRKVKWEGVNPPNQKKFVPQRIPNASELVVTFEVVTRDNDESYVNTIFKFSSPVEGMPIHFKCRLTLLDKKGGVLLTSQLYSHTFTDEEWSPPPTPPFLTKSVCLEKKPHAVRCDVRFGNMSYANLDSCDLSVVGGMIPLFNDLSMMSQDLLRMYEKRIKCDMKIEVVEKEFLGHRNFLRKRSGLIWDKLENLRKVPENKKPLIETIKLEGVSPHIFDEMMRFLYSGKIQMEDKDTAIELATTANYLRLPLIIHKLVYVQQC